MMSLVAVSIYLLEVLLTERKTNVLLKLIHYTILFASYPCPYQAAFKNKNRGVFRTLLNLRQKVL